MSKLGARRSWQPQTITVGARSLSFPAFEHGTESGERLVGGHPCHFATGSTSHRIQITGVLVIVAVQAKQLPIASVGRVVFVVVVSVVHRELVQIFKGKFARTTATDPGIDLERLLPIALFAPLPVSSRLGDHPVQFVVIWLGQFANTRVELRGCTPPSATILLAMALRKIQLPGTGHVRTSAQGRNATCSDWL